MIRFALVLLAAQIGQIPVPDYSPTTETIADGSWWSDSIWTNGTPDGTVDAAVRHAITVEVQQVAYDFGDVNQDGNVDAADYAQLLPALEAATNSGDWASVQQTLTDAQTGPTITRAEAQDLMIDGGSVSLGQDAGLQLESLQLNNSGKVQAQ